MESEHRDQPRRLHVLALDALYKELEGTEISDKIAEMNVAFDALYAFERFLCQCSPEHVYEAQYTSFGIVSRFYQLFISAILNLQMRNLNGFHVSERSIIETVGLTYWCADKPERLISVFQSENVNEGKMLASCYRHHPELKKMYKDSSKIVHPSRSSFAINLIAYKQDKDEGIVSGLTMYFSDHMAFEKLCSLCVLAQSMQISLKRLDVQGCQIFMKGKMLSYMKDSVRFTTNNFSCQGWEPKEE